MFFPSRFSMNVRFPVIGGAQTELTLAEKMNYFNLKLNTKYFLCSKHVTSEKFLGGFFFFNL